VVNCAIIPAGWSRCLGQTSSPPSRTCRPATAPPTPSLPRLPHTAPPSAPLPKRKRPAPHSGKKGSTPRGYPALSTGWAHLENSRMSFLPSVTPIVTGTCISATYAAATADYSEAIVAAPTVIQSRSQPCRGMQAPLVTAPMLATLDPKAQDLVGKHAGAPRRGAWLPRLNKLRKTE
jgi:hypothetical protein